MGRELSRLAIDFKHRQCRADMGKIALRRFDLALIVRNQPLYVIALAAELRLPAIYPYRFFATAGGLISYGAEPLELFPRAASYADRILKGAKPADLPVQQPTKYELVINLNTAKALGLTIPPTLVARADEVIE